ncbi:hypothetical protein [Cereibacter johrii]|uniref:hypothetical protein n=1 Tax=Cereibacter johrii TaxID=445629 RepID=UPI000DCCA5EA|nr:hypothetical protein [Cereibacter johrii]RAZ83409.1 hypothetical protein DDV93_13940 [Cereibacter johrii]
MARSYLPSKKTVNIRTGQLYALFDGEQHYQNLGWVENAKLAIDVSEEDVKAATGGTAYTVKTIVTEAGGTLTVTLLNSTARIPSRSPHSSLSSPYRPAPELRRPPTRRA